MISILDASVPLSQSGQNFLLHLGLVITLTGIVIRLILWR